VGLLKRVRNEQSVERAITTLESLLGNARESGEVNALLARALSVQGVAHAAPGADRTGHGVRGSRA
jgi:hypothetical protein